MLTPDQLPSYRDASRFGSLQAAHDSLPSAGGTIVLRNTTYTLSSTLTISKPVTILGAGARSGCLIRKTSGTHSLITVTTGGSLTIEGVGFDGNYPTTTSGDAISFGSTSVPLSGLTVRRCHFANISGNAISLTRASYVWIENNTFDTLYNSGVRLNAPGSGNKNDHIWIHDNHIKNAQQSQPTAGNAAIQSAGGDSTQANEYVWVERNRIEQSGVVGIGLDWIQRAWVTDNDIEGNGTRGEGIAFTGSYVTIRGNRSHGNGAAGILQWALTTEPNGNQHNRIVDNECWDNAQGIALVWGNQNADIQYLSVLHNRCYNTASGPSQTYGIQSYMGGGVTVGTWSFANVSYNDVRGNATGGLNLVAVSGTGNTRYANIETQADSTSVADSRHPYANGFIASGGQSDVTSTLTLMHGWHRDEGATVTGSLGRIVAGFNTNNDRKIAGFQAKKATTFANRTDLELLASKDGNTTGVTVVGKGISSTTNGVSGFGPADSAWNGPHLIMGTYHFWVDATGALRIKSSAPTSETDGVIVGTQS